MVFKHDRWFKTLIIAIVVLCTVAPLSASPAPGADYHEVSSASPIFIRLTAATFDPLQSPLALPEQLSFTPDEAISAGAYIVQFSGPVREEWKQSLAAAGAQLGDYVPDYAFLVYLDAASKANVEGLPFVRWVGAYQPAYKLAADVDYDDTRSYRVMLAPWADVQATRTALNSLNASPRGYSGGFAAVLSGEQLDQVARMPGVVWIEPYHVQRLHNDVGGGTIMGGSTAWASGYTGSGVTVAIADTGLDTANTGTIHQDFSGRVTHISSWPVLYANYGGGCEITNAGADDGAADVKSGHGTHVAGSVAGSGAASGGQFKGLGYEASVTFQAIEQLTQYTAQCGVSGNQGYGLSGIPDDTRTLLNEAYGWGARIHNNSWGGGDYGVYDQQAAYFDDFIYAHQDMAVFVSAGNDGTDADSNGYVDENSISSPASAKNTITVGASENERASGGYSGYNWGDGWPSDYPANPTSGDRISSDREHLAAFSSRGPMNDGRIKPDVVAPGTDIVSVRSSLATGTGWGTYNSYYMYDGGTSMASPLTAGAGAVVRDYYITQGHANPSAALVKATLINTAVDISGYGNAGQEAGLPIPNNHEGWGRVDVGAATTPGSRQFDDNTTGVGTGATQTYHYMASAGKPFKATLVWSDPAATPAANPTLVNNLNLRVTAPDGATTYWGNNFSGGWSQTGGSADAINNVENVYIQSPAAGQWTVEVFGQNVPQGPQQFALLVDGVTTNVYGVTIEPAAAAQAGDASTTVTYTLRVTNTGNTTDTFTLSKSGNAWTTDVPASTGVLAAGAGESVDVVVHIPSTGNASDVATITATSQNDSSKKDSSTLATTRYEYGANLTPGGAVVVVNPGDEVIYSLRLHNIGNVEQTYALTRTGNTWTTTLSPAMVNLLPAGQSALLEATVNVPADAADGDSDTVEVQAARDGHAGVLATSMLKTIAVTQTITRSVDSDPNAPGKSGDPGQGVTYTLHITNTSSITDTLVFSLTSDWEGTVWPAWAVLAAGEGQPVSVAITVPANAVDKDQRIVTLSAFSIINPEVQASAVFTVTASRPLRLVYLPILLKAWPPIPNAPTLNAITPNPSSDGSYTVSWSAGAGPAPTSYDLEENGTVILTNLTGASRSFTSKAVGTYTYRVRGKNNYGPGAWSGAQSVTVQPQLPAVLYSVGDASVLQGIPSVNDGSEGDMWTGYEHSACNIGGFSGINRALVKFDPSSIPAGTQIANATLSLYLVGSCDTGNHSRTFTIYRVSSDWSEGAVTWNSRPGYAEAYGSGTVSSLGWGRYSANVTDLVRGWVNGSFTNYGLMVRSPESSSDARLSFGTRDAGSTYIPYITLTYAGAAASEKPLAIETNPTLASCESIIKGWPDLPLVTDGEGFRVAGTPLCTPH